MSNQILSILEFLEKEKGINRNEIISTIISSIENSENKGIYSGNTLKIEISPKTGTIYAYILLTIVNKVNDPKQEININEVISFNKNFQIGDIFKKTIKFQNIGRIAAQIAKKTIIQKIKQLEKEKTINQFKRLIGKIIIGTIRHKDKYRVIIDIGKTDAILPFNEKIETEHYMIGERIKCQLLRIEKKMNNYEIILTRIHPNFILRLMETEIEELKNGSVIIKGLSREPGYRTKISVFSKNGKIDPIGSCIGICGSRIKAIIRELRVKEKIDIIHYYQDIEKYLKSSILPIIPYNLKINKEKKALYFEVLEQDFPILIGKNGQNARLTSMLLGWSLNIGRINNHSLIKGNTDKY